MGTPGKTGWDIADILLRPVGGLLTALSVAGVGFFGSRYLEERQMNETNVRLYAEIMSGRESADSQLRKDMFNMAIGTLLENEPEDIEKLLLELELLAFNFHDAIDLAPLFQHMGRKIEDSSEPHGRKNDWRTRLERVAKEILAKQVAVLEDAGRVVHAAFDPNVLATAGFVCIAETDFGDVLRMASAEDPTVCAEFGDETGRADGDGAERYLVILEAIDVDRDARETRIRLTVATTGDPSPMLDVDFNVGFFDFPLIDNTRLPSLRGLPSDERCAVVLRNFQDYQVELSLLCFPGSRASLKEKPYYDQIIDQLTYTRHQMRAQR
jgi:hypothetical protein